ncbi:MAG: hypothetical protein WBB21_01355, partial [Saprospiraceae bacterium]
FYAIVWSARAKSMKLMQLGCNSRVIYFCASLLADTKLSSLVRYSPICFMPFYAIKCNFKAVPLY